MKFIVSSAYLLKQLSAINGVVTTNPIVPILENFLFAIDNGNLTVTASDLQTSMIVELQVESNENGKIAVPAKMLLDTLRNLPEQPVTFSVDDQTYGVEITSANGRYKLSGENPADFPNINISDLTNKLEISASTLSNVFYHTLIATSNDELRPAMTGVFVEFNSNETSFVSTDTHRLIKCTRSDIASNSSSSMIVPRKALTLLRAVLPTEDEKVTFGFNESNATFTFDNITLICRLIDERFPDYAQVIPLDNPNQLTINRTDFLGTLKRVAIYSNKSSNQIKLKFAGSELKVYTEDLDFSNEASELLKSDYVGQDMEIGFNVKFLIELLSNMSAEEIVMKMSTPFKAATITPSEGDDNILMLLMPVDIGQYNYNAQ